MRKEEIDQLHDEIKKISIREKIDESKAFIFWSLTSYYGIQIPEIYEYIVDSGQDKRIDAFIPIEQDRLTLIQAKYFTNVKKVVSEKDIALFYSCITTLKNPSRLSDKSPLLNIAELYEEICEAEGEIELHYFATGKFDDSAINEKITFNNLAENSGRIQLFFHDLNDILNTLKASISEVNPLMTEVVKLPVFAGQYFANEIDIYPSYICTIEANHIAKLYEKYSNSLFDRNIRYYKGSKSGSINSKIIETVADKKERKNFWYYNNGITIVCTSIKPYQKNGQTFVKITGPQIINGCQTTVSLYEASEKFYPDKKIPKDVKLIVRFIQTSTNDTDLITLYTNSQNPVSAYQLRSNDEIQRKIKDDLTKYNPPFFYETKEGERRLHRKAIKTDFDNRVLDMVQTAQAIYAALFDPAYARRFKKNLFSDHYSKIFRKDIALHEILLPNLVLDLINLHIKEFKNNEFSKIKEEELSEQLKKDIKSKEFLLYSNLIYLYFIWSMIKKKYGQYDSNIAAKLINNKLNDRTKKMFDYITSILKYNHELQSTNPQRYLKNIKNINKMKDELFKEIDKDSAKGKNPLSEFLPNI